MNPAKIIMNGVGFIAGAAVAGLLAGCVDVADGGGYGGPVAGTGSVEIGAETDFYEPLSPYGQWEVVGAYGRCWVPRGVGPDWRPYGDGEWVSTDDGWYFESDEPWGWATYHYGRWEDEPSIGWCWIPGTQWAPAWVSWWEGDGYVGWAPLGSHDRFERGRFEGRRPRDRDFVFVEERRFTERVRPTTVVRNNSNLISRTTSVTNFRVVNNVTVNAGPRRENIERASGRTVKTVPARDVRQQREAPFIQHRQQQHPAAGGNAAPNHRTTTGAPTMGHPVAPAVANPPPVSHREAAPTYHPAPTVTPKPEGNRLHPVEGTQSRVVTPPPPSRQFSPPPKPVNPPPPAGPVTHHGESTRQTTEHTVAPAHVNRSVNPAVEPKPQGTPAHTNQTVKPGAGLKPQAAPKGGGPKEGNAEPKSDHAEKTRQQQDN